MAIDITKEKLISLSEAAELVPSYRTAKDGSPMPTHSTRLKRAIEKRELEGAKVGRSWTTSVEAIQRWIDRSTLNAIGETQVTTEEFEKSIGPKTRRARVAAIKATDEQLKRWNI